jgi:hypothetical protein
MFFKTRALLTFANNSEYCVRGWKCNECLDEYSLIFVASEFADGPYDEGVMREAQVSPRFLT